MFPYVMWSWLILTGAVPDSARLNSKYAYVGKIRKFFDLRILENFFRYLFLFNSIDQIFRKVKRFKNRVYFCFSSIVDFDTVSDLFLKI